MADNRDVFEKALGEEGHDEARQRARVASVLTGIVGLGGAALTGGRLNKLLRRAKTPAQRKQLLSAMRSLSVTSGGLALTSGATGAYGFGGHKRRKK